MVTNTLTALRTSVVDALTAAGLPASEYVQERVTPPLVVVVPGSPYVAGGAEGTPFGHLNVTLQVLVIAGKGTNRAAAEWVDATVVTVLDVLGDQWDATEVSQPGEVQINGQHFLGAVVTVEQDARLG